MVKMIVGLGNPGAQYHETKHNIGFMVLDEWAKQEQLTFNKSKFEALYTELSIDGEKVYLVKPQTSMNVSGRSVKPFMNYFNVDIKDLVVIYDDMDLPVGKIRLRQKGSAGGHNGVRSLIQHLGTSEFNRVRIGVGRPPEYETVIQHVLSKFLLFDKPAVDESVQKTVSALQHWVKVDSFLKAMNEYN